MFTREEILEEFAETTQSGNEHFARVVAPRRRDRAAEAIAAQERRDAKAPEQKRIERRAAYERMRRDPERYAQTLERNRRARDKMSKRAKLSLDS